MSDSDDLAAFLEARLGETEAAAKAWESAPWLERGEEAVHWRPVGSRNVRYDNGASEHFQAIDVRGTEVMWAEAIQVRWDTNGERAAHIALHDPARVLRDIEADRKLLAELAQAADYSDRVFGPVPPRDIAPGEWPAERLRAATQVLVLERVIRIRAERFSGHADYEDGWKPS